MKYLVLTESDFELARCVQNLNKKVNVWLKDGYELAGGVSMSVVGGGYFAAQAVVKNRREKNDVSGSN